MSDIPEKRHPIRPKQQRSIARFEFILDCAEAVLSRRGVDQAAEVSIYDVADEANLAAPAVYRYFPSSSAIHIALSERYMDQIAVFVDQGDYSSCSSWQMALEHSMSLARDFYNAHPLALDLILGPLATRDIRKFDKHNNSTIALDVLARLEQSSHAFHSLANAREFEIVIAIVDAIWSESHFRHGSITADYFVESIRAVTAYLELYTVRSLPSGTNTAEIASSTP